MSSITGCSKTVDIRSLDDDVILGIFSHLKLCDILQCSLVSKAFKQLARDATLWKKLIYNEISFSPKKWIELFGDISITREMREEAFASLPWNIRDILKSPSPFIPRHIQVKKCHTLVWIPKGLTIKKFGEFIKPHFPKSDTEGYAYISDDVIKQFGDIENKESYWALMTNAPIIFTDVVSSFDSKKKTFSYYAEEGGIPHKIPGVLEAAVCILAQHFLSKKDPFVNKQTYCIEEIDTRHVIIGNFVPSKGLLIFRSESLYSTAGMAALRRI